MACAHSNVAAAQASAAQARRPFVPSSSNSSTVRLHSPNLVRKYVAFRPTALAAASNGAQQEGVNLQVAQKGKDLPGPAAGAPTPPPPPPPRRRPRASPSLLLDAWDPFSRGGLRQMMDVVDQLFLDNVSPAGASASRSATGAATGRTPWDVVEDEEGFHIRVDMPGFGKEDVKVAVEDDVLVIIGQRDPSKEDAHWASKSYSKFNTRLALPESSHLDKISAELSNGVLFVTVPKVKPEERKQVIDIQVA